MLDKMSSVMQRSCNYSNVDKIIQQARYDDDKNQYILPELTVEEIQLPQMGNLPVPTNGRTPHNDYSVPSKSTTTPPTAEYENDFIEPIEMHNGYHHQYSSMTAEELERRYGRNESSSVLTEKARNKRQEHLLNESSLLQRASRPSRMNSVENNYMNRRLNQNDISARLGRKYGFSSDKQ